MPWQVPHKNMSSTWATHGWQPHGKMLCDARTNQNMMKPLYSLKWIYNFISSAILWVVLVLVLVPNRMMYPICWSAADILINNSVFPEDLGLVNGLSMTCSFFARSASPLAAGSIFSWYDLRSSHAYLKKFMFIGWPISRSVMLWWKPRKRF